MNGPHSGTADDQPDAAQRFDMEGLIGYILLAGVLISVVLVVVGLLSHWAATGSLGIVYMIRGRNLLRFLVAVSDAMGSPLHRADLLVNLGIGVLMLTPYVRVLGSALYFAFVARDWKYTLFTAVVLFVLTYTLFIR